MRKIAFVILILMFLLTLVSCEEGNKVIDVSNGEPPVISSGGAYEFKGTLADKFIVVDTQSTSRVELILSGVEMAGIHVRNADKVTIILTEGKTNTFNDKSVYDGSEFNACICSKDDLEITGSGKLIVDGANNGIDSSNDLKISGGDITVTAGNNGLKGNDSVEIIGGIISIESNDDGIKIDTADRPDKGYFRMTGGTVEVKAADDCIQSTNEVTVTGGALTVTAGGKYINCTGTVEVADGAMINK